MFSSDLIFDVLRRHQPDHLLLRCARTDASQGLMDLPRLGEFLARIKGRIQVKRLPKLSPFAVPMLMEIGREPVYGGHAPEMILEAAALDALIEEAMA
jgi:ATP-dependent Lhr-like helicase